MLAPQSLNDSSLSWVNPRRSPFRGVFELPGDKSLSHRALFLAAMSQGQCCLEGLPIQEDGRGAGDILSTLGLLKKLGVTIRRRGSVLELDAAGFCRGADYDGEVSLDCGNSATCMRLAAGVLAARPGRWLLSGDASLLTRPMQRIVEPLRAMGADIVALGAQGRPPLRIVGRANLQPIKWSSPQASAQVKSAVLLAALSAPGLSEFSEPGLSRDHTERMLNWLGISVVSRPWGAGRTVALQGPAVVPAFNYQVPGDPSSAAFLAALAVIKAGSSITINNLNLNPGRLGWLTILQRMGARCTSHVDSHFQGEDLGSLRAEFSSLHGTVISGDEVPQSVDELPLLTFLATFAEGETRLSGASELRLKESDRLHGIIEELTKFSVRIDEHFDGLALSGPQKLEFVGSEALDCHGDHRLEMTLMLAAFCAPRAVPFKSLGASAISFPGYAQLFLEPKSFWLFGHPLGHSLSSSLHKSLYAFLKLPYHYEAKDLPSERDLEEAWSSLAAEASGCNVTLPYKEAAYNYLCAQGEIASQSRCMHSLNTIKVRADRSLWGCSTDGPGWIAAWQERFGLALQGRRVVVFGSGGAAKSVVLALAEQGIAELYMVNRTLQSAVSLAELLNHEFPQLQVHCGDIQQWSWQAGDLAIQATSLGMWGENQSRSPFNWQGAPGWAQGIYACDLVYRPAQTEFLRLAGEAGAQTWGGSAMLVYQAILALQVFMAPDGQEEQALQGHDLIDCLPEDFLTQLCQATAQADFSALLT